MIHKLFRTKSIEDLRASAVEDAEHPGLKKNLSAFDLTMFGIGAIIGAGIFSSIGQGAAGDPVQGYIGAGPALVISFILTGIACGFTGLCYAELASMIPISGSAYTYAYATLGELMAWIIGWDLVLEYAVSNVAVAISWGDYVRSLLMKFHIVIPAWLAVDPRKALDVSDGYIAAHHLSQQPYFGEKVHLFEQVRQGVFSGPGTFANWEALAHAPVLFGIPCTINLMAVVITVLVTWLCYIGIKESARANSIMVIVKLIILGLFVAVGTHYIDSANYHPFAPNGWTGIQGGAAIIFFAFIGFDAVSTTAEECRDPGKDLPRGIMWSLGICTLVYILVALVVTGMVKYSDLGGKADPLAYVLDVKNLQMYSAIISVGAIIALTACLLVYQIGQPRIFMSMSRDGLLGRWFGQVDKKHGTPANATILTGFLVAIPAALMNIEEVIALTNIGTLFAFIIACAGVIILRVKRPEVERKFRAPAVWLIAPLGIVSCLWLAWGLPVITKIRFVVWLVVGLFIYFLYGARRSVLGQRQADDD